MKIRQGTVFTLVNHLVTEAARAQRKPRLHPNGFIQLDLTDDKRVRLHVWPAGRVLAAQRTHHPIHDHAFAMESLILRGCMRNVLYEAQPLSAALARDAKFLTYRLHRAEYIGGAESILKPAAATDCALIETSADDYEAGESYAMPAYRLHDSVPHGFTATLMTKISVDERYAPLIAVPTGVNPDNDFRRGAVDEKTLWHWIGRAIE